MVENSPNEARVYEWLRARNHPFEVQEHKPIYTVAEGEEVRRTMPGGFAKNLLVTDKKSALRLLVALGTIQVDLKGTAKAIGAAGRFSFAKEERMVEALGVTPGSVTPLALIHEGSHLIKEVVLDTNLLAHNPIWCHPLRNNASLALSAEALLDFVKAHHGDPRLLDLSQPMETTTAS